MLRIKWVLFFFLFVQFSFAQTPTERNRVGGQYWTTLQANIVRKDSMSSCFFEYAKRYNPANYAPIISNDYRFVRAHLMAGYQHVFSPHWRVGISERVALERTQDASVENPNTFIFFTRLFVQHDGTFLKHFQVKKRIALQRTDFTNDPSREDQKSRWYFSGAIERPFEIKNRHFTAEIGYTAIKMNPNLSQRTFFMSRAWGQLSYYFSNSLRVDLYYLSASRYLYALATFDQDGNVLKPNRNLNQINGVLGCRFHLNFGKPLQTVHLTNLDF